MENISYESWLEEYKPIKEDGETLRDFWGEEDWSSEEFKRAQKEQRVWTLVAGGDHIQLFISPGVRVINRLEMYITKKPWKDGMEDIPYYDDEEYYDEIISTIQVLLDLPDNKDSGNKVEKILNQDGREDKIESALEYSMALGEVLEHEPTNNILNMSYKEVVNYGN